MTLPLHNSGEVLSSILSESCLFALLDGSFGLFGRFLASHAKERPAAAICDTQDSPGIATMSDNNGMRAVAGHSSKLACISATQHGFVDEQYIMPASAR